jgi:hypothetical protein
LVEVVATPVVPPVKSQVATPPIKLTVAVAVAVHPELVPDTVYTVVTVGDAVTVAPVVALRPVDGDQV